MLQILQQSNHFLPPQLLVAPSAEAFFLCVQLSPKSIGDGRGCDRITGDQMFAVPAAEQAGGTQNGTRFKFSQGDQSPLIVAHQACSAFHQDQNPPWNHTGFHQGFTQLEGEQVQLFA